MTFAGIYPFKCSYQVLVVVQIYFHNAGKLPGDVSVIIVAIKHPGSIATGINRNRDSGMSIRGEADTSFAV